MNKPWPVIESHPHGTEPYNLLRLGSWHHPDVMTFEHRGASGMTEFKGQSFQRLS